MVVESLAIYNYYTYHEIRKRICPTSLPCSRLSLQGIDLPLPGKQLPLSPLLFLVHGGLGSQARHRQRIRHGDGQDPSVQQMVLWR